MKYRFINNISGSFCLAKTLFWSELKSKYRESFLGYLWILAPALFLTISFYLAYDSNVIISGELPLPYPIFAYSGIILWQLFSDLINSFSTGIGKARSLLLKIKVDTNSIIISKFFEVLFDFTIKLFFLFVLMIAFNIPINESMILFPVGIAMIILLGVSIALIISPFVLLVQDINRILPTVLSFGMFITPIFYNTPNGKLAFILNLNPMTHMIYFTRSTIYGEVIIGTYFLIAIPSCLLLLPLAYRLHKISLPIIIERLGN